MKGEGHAVCLGQDIDTDLVIAGVTSGPKTTACG